ncbi:MAG: HD domain-containing protein [Mariprofundaceae bacterium]|nr:HD domain-containing protein [Mariprofundaceae bacterium]
MKWLLGRSVADKELAFQNEEKEKRAAELLIANKELAFQNEEKEKRAAELLIANKELAFQNEEKEKRAAELVKSHLDLKNNLLDTVKVIAKAVEMRDPYTAGHQQRVAEIACAIAGEMGLDEDQITGVRLGATIHNIGTLQIPAEILSRPGKLTDVEYQLVQTHAGLGYDILKDVRFPWPLADIAHQHHERMDGSGYPQGLNGVQICLEARIVAVADVAGAMSSHRPYRASLGIQAALDEIKTKRGILYDPEVVDACLKAYEGKRFSV